MQLLTLNFFILNSQKHIGIRSKLINVPILIVFLLFKTLLL